MKKTTVCVIPDCQVPFYLDKKSSLSQQIKYFPYSSCPIYAPSQNESLNFKVIEQQVLFAKSKIKS